MQHRQPRERPFERTKNLDANTKKGTPSGSLLVELVREEACDLVCYIIQVRLQLREIEALCKSWLLRLGRQDGVRFIHALVPPRPAALLRVPQVSTVTPFPS
jgi:hypothetical protein